MTEPLSAVLLARTRSIGEPRWLPGGPAPRIAWVESYAGTADVMVAPVPGGAPRSCTAAHGARAAAAYGGGTFAVAPGGTVVFVAGSGALMTTVGVVLCHDGRVSAPAVSADGTRVAFMLEREDSCDIAVVPIDGSAWPVKVSTGADYSFDPVWSPDGHTLAWHEWDFPNMPWDGSRIVTRAIDGLRPGGSVRVVAGGDAIATGQPRFAPDGRALAYVSDEDGFMNIRVARPDGSRARPLHEESFEQAEPSWSPGQRSFAWSPGADAIAYCRNEDGFGRLVVAPVGRGKARDLAKGWHHGLDWNAGGIVAMRAGAVTPPQIVLVDPANGDRTVAAYSAPEGVERGAVEPEAITWKGDDRGVVHGLFFRPAAASTAGPGTPPPLLVYVHGGPTGSALATWNARIQFFVSRGWAVLAPNHRGSAGHGRAYAQALTGKWGELEIADTVAGIRHVTKKGMADGTRVAAYGGSAGGMAVLLLCAWHGDVVRAGVDLFGVADLFHLAEATHRFESRYLDRIVGELPADAARYHDRSPINHVERINVPLLVLQGDRDPAVPKVQADMIVEQLRARGAPVEYQVYEGEGHGWSRPETLVDELNRADAFLTRWVLRR